MLEKKHVIIFNPQNGYSSKITIEIILLPLTLPPKPINSIMAVLDWT